MSLNITTGACWERSDEKEEEDSNQGQSKLFLNRRANRDFKINEIIRNKAYKEFLTEEKTAKENGIEDENEGKEPGDGQKEETEKEVIQELVVEEEDEAVKRKKRKEEQACTKEEYAVAKHLRFNTPAHTGRLAGMTVKCFIASDAVNCLLDSKWAKGKANPDSEIVFSDRRSCVQFLNRFISKGLFHRADKVDSRKDKDKKKKKKEIEEKDKEKDKENGADSKKSKKSKKQPEKETKEEEKKEDKKKTDKKEVKLKKFKLNMSDDQRYVDGNSIYVWIYDPIHPKTFFMGFLMLLGAIALCLFPLWPDWMRVGVYYASLLGASFVGFMLFLIILRVIIFSIVWVVTLGKHHFWIFPNLTEDVGVIDSFKPLYKHDVYPPPEIEKEMEKEKKLEEEEEEEESENEDNVENKDNDYEMIEAKNNDTNDEKTGEESEETEQQ